MSKLFEAPASQWEKLARVIGEAFAAREAMVWSADADVARVLSDRRWDGSVPAPERRLRLPAEFEYANKNGRELRRTYDHHVAVAPMGRPRSRRTSRSPTRILSRTRTCPTA